MDRDLSKLIPLVVTALACVGLVAVSYYKQSKGEPQPSLIPPSFECETEINQVVSDVDGSETPRRAEAEKKTSDEADSKTSNDVLPSYAKKFDLDLDVYILDIPRLNDLLPELDAHYDNMRLPIIRAHEKESESSPPKDSQSDETKMVEYRNYIDENFIILGDIVRNTKQKPICRGFIRAGPRHKTYFDPKTVRAAIVTCGGLCPGMNNVIRDITRALINSYGVEKVYGVRNGFWGFHTRDADPDGHARGDHECATEEPVVLTPESVRLIQYQGGTVLGSSRGGDDVSVILRFCRNRSISQLYLIGGDGSHRCADLVATAAQQQGLCLSVAVVPKAVDNDVAVIDRSFGFDSAVTEAIRAIRSAKVEASGASCGIGIVKLMGRYAGFIAAHASIASGDVDLCLLPEVPLALDGPSCFLNHIRLCILRKGHCVVVVAEGAGEDILKHELLAKGEKLQYDDSGVSRQLLKTGPWIQQKIRTYLSAFDMTPSIKYIDNSYMIRSIPANAADSIYCTLLAQNAVHGSMAGFTGFSVGLVNNRMVLIPIKEITSKSPRRMDVNGRTYERLLQITRQPDPLLHPDLYKFLKD